MGWFDAVCHAMSTVATGGVSTKQASIAAFNSPAIEYVITFFMFVSGVNLSLLYLAIFRWRPMALLRDTEFKTYFGVVAGFSLVIGVGLFFTSGVGVAAALRASLCRVVSLQAPPGLATVHYAVWMPLLWLLLCALMFIGACSGSTSGAMKCARISILFKVMWNEFKRIVHPNAVIPVRMTGRIIPSAVQSAILAYTVIYIFMLRMITS